MGLYSVDKNFGFQLTIPTLEYKGRNTYEI